MKFLLAAINAKYIHSNPGVYSLRAFARTKISWADIEIGEYTINHQMDLILQDIYRRKPDFIGFSCYIWNISYIMEIVRDVKKVLPEVEIWLGGPEVSYDAKKVLTREPDVCGVMRGEGELTFTELVREYLKREELPAAGLDLDHIPGITYRAENGEIVEHLTALQFHAALRPHVVRLSGTHRLVGDEPEPGGPLAVYHRIGDGLRQIQLTDGDEPLVDRVAGLVGAFRNRFDRHLLLAVIERLQRA